MSTYKLHRSYLHDVKQDQKFWNLLGFVLASENRRKVMFCLARAYATPKQISVVCGIRIGHVSNILIGLNEKKLVYCKNPDAKRGRIYSLTDLGERIVASIKKAALTWHMISSENRTQNLLL